MNGAYVAANEPSPWLYRGCKDVSEFGVGKQRPAQAEHDVIRPRVFWAENCNYI
jgi:hypothetical protein